MIAPMVLQNNNSESIEDDYEDEKQDVEDEYEEGPYCPACQQAPCMCSDPQWRMDWGYENLNNEFRQEIFKIEI